MVLLTSVSNIVILCGSESKLHAETYGMKLLTV